MAVGPVHGTGDVVVLPQGVDGVEAVMALLWFAAMACVVMAVRTAYLLGVVAGRNAAENDLAETLGHPPTLKSR